MGQYKKYFINFLIVFCYIVISIFVYFVSIRNGRQGVSLQLFGGGDDGIYYWQQINNYLNGNDTTIYTSYVPIVAKFITFFGFRDPIIVRLFNIIGFILLLFFINRTIYYILSETVRFDLIVISQIKTVVVLSCYLSLIMMTLLSIYRDIWIYLFFLMSIYFSLKCLYRFRLKQLVYFIVSLVLLYSFRGYAAMSVFLGFCLFILVKNSFKSGRVVSNLMILFIFLLLYFQFFKEIRLPLVNMSLSDVFSYRESDLNIGNSQLYIKLNVSNSFQFLFNYFYSFISNVFGPMIWQIKSVSQVLVFLFETIPFVWMIYRIVKYKRFLDFKLNYFMFQSLVWFSLISISNDNLGTATRLRIVGWIPIVIVFFCLSAKLKEYNERKRI